MSGGVVSELEKRVAAALKATARGTGLSCDRIIRLISVHQALKTQRATGLLTDAEYAKEAREVLNVLANFDGPIVETANGDSR